MGGELRSTARPSYAVEPEAPTSRAADVAALLVVLALLVGGVLLFLSDDAAAEPACAATGLCATQP